MREQTRSNCVEKLLFRKLSLKDNLHNTKKTTEEIAEGILAFAEYKRTIGLIY